MKEPAKHLGSLVFRENPKPSDSEDILDIVRSSSFFSPEECGIAVELIEERWRMGEASGYFFLFAEKEERVIGYTCFGPIPGTRESYDLYWIAVHQDYRGAGLGKKLLDRSEELMTAKGCGRIYIETSCRELYTPTRQFYEKCGYRAEAILKDYYAPGDSKAIYLKELTR